jgi:alpha-1,6-mannosyltransferase
MIERAPRTEITAEMRRHLWALAGCGACIGVCTVAFNLLYLFVPAGWTPLHGFAPTIGAAYGRWLALPHVVLSTKQVTVASAVLQAGMWAAFFAAIAIAARLRDGAASRAAFRLIAIGGAAISVVLILTPPTLSPDLYHYALFGRMIITRALNPYVTAGSALAGDPLFPLASWPQFSTHYGPVFTGLSVVATWIGGGHAIGTALAFKTLAVAGGALAAWSAATLARHEGRDDLLPFALVAWNPLALVEAAGSGHNELVMMGLALLGVLVARRGRPNTGFALVIASAHVKWITGALAALLALAGVREAAGARARLLELGRLVAVAAAVTVVLYAPFWAGMRGLAATGGLLGTTRTDVSAAGTISATNLILFAVVVAIAAALVLRRGGPVALDAAALVSMAFVTFVFPWVFPWYILPTVALATVGPRTRLNVGLLMIAGAASMFLMACWAVLRPQ